MRSEMTGIWYDYTSSPRASMYVSIVYFIHGLYCSNLRWCSLDLLLSAAPIESHVGAVVVCARSPAWKV